MLDWNAWKLLTVSKNLIIGISQKFLELFKCAQMNELLWIELSVLDSNTWKHFTVWKEMSSGFFLYITYNVFVYNRIYLIYV